MNNIDIKKELQKPFSITDIEWRIQQSGIKLKVDEKTQKQIEKPWAIVLVYVTNRAIQERLDEVFGVDGWSNSYVQAPDGGVLCGITAMGVTKWDGAENTRIESIKGGLSSAMKRAAVQWGIGRYLYKLDINFAKFCDYKEGKYKEEINNKWYGWNPPTLPKWALPEGEYEKQEAAKIIKEVREIKENFEETFENVEMVEIVHKPTKEEMQKVADYQQKKVYPKKDGPQSGKDIPFTKEHHEYFLEKIAGAFDSGAELDAYLAENSYNGYIDNYEKIKSTAQMYFYIGKIQKEFGLKKS